MFLDLFAPVLFFTLSVRAEVLPRQTEAPYVYGNETAPTAPVVTGTSKPQSTGRLFPNQTHSQCCFVIQDTVTADYWAHYFTSTWYGLRNVTSLISSITEYVDTTITNYETITTIKNATYLTTFQVGYNAMTSQNAYSGAPWTYSSMINETTATISGQPVTSPAAFYVYPSVKIINVPAITQADGQLACRATSVWSLMCPDGKTKSVSGTSTIYGSFTRSVAEYTDINTNAAAYFSGQLGPSRSTTTYTPYLYSISTYASHNTTSTATISRNSTNTAAFRTTAEISFSTPFLFFPAAGKTVATRPVDVWIMPASVQSTSTGDITSTIHITKTRTSYVTSTSTPTSTSTYHPGTTHIVNHDYGYIPQELIDWMVKNPNYAAQYSGLESCLPGGPTIVPAVGCAEVAPAVATAVPALTTGQAVTVKGAGCFNPVNCKVAGGDSATPVEAAPAIDSATPKLPVLPTATALSPGNTEAEDGSAEDGSNGGSQQTSNAEQPSESHESVPVIIITTPEGSRQTSKPSSGLGAIIAGAFGPHSSSSEDSSGNQPSDVEEPQTLATGTPPVVISGSTISLAPTASAIGVDGDTNTSPGQAVNPNPAPVITIGSQAITANSASQYIVKSQTLAAGSSAIVVSGSTYSLAPFASAIIINGHTSSLPSIVAPTNAAPVITIAGNAVTINSASQFIVGSQTLAPGSAQIEVSGTTYSLAPSASAIVINGVTSALAKTGSGVPPEITIGGQTITANSASEYIIASQTLAPGSPAITVSGTTYSLAPSASALVVNGVTSTLPSALPSTASPRLISIGSQVLTARPIASGSGYLVGSQTLVPGASAITIDGVEVSLAQGASSIVVGGSTEGFGAPTRGVGGNGTGSFDGVAFTGGAGTVGRGFIGQSIGLGIGLLGLVML